ncbi:MAG TPA: DUF2723 domain-containing protein [Gemmatimonadales bacterium]|nr:DUF2723 domain-containing protein [Gemmatimonadales bacterium]
MTVPPTARPPVSPPPSPPYGLAALVAAVVLAGYVFTLAPTVTFWDAGELIASMKTLGIPHPPGTPLFVLIGNVWAQLVPFGEYAWRTNLLSAVMSAGAAGLWFLVLHETASRIARHDDGPARPGLTLAAAAAGVILSAFGFTNWLNSNETEVYTVSTFTIAAIAWTMLRWRAARGTPRAAQLLLLVAYLMGVTIGNHLLGLLVGPAVVALIVAELRSRPASSLGVRMEEWAHAAVMAGLWALLTGVGLGSVTLSILGGLVFAVAAGFAAVSARQLPFALMMLAVALVGVTPYLFLYIRAGQHPVINESDPSTWDALLGVIRREQYPVRTPFDDPTQLHGPENTGRSLTIIGLQLVNYIQYFDWQWGKAFPGGISIGSGQLPFRTVFTLVFVALGLSGIRAQWRSDRSGAWCLLTLFFFTGLGLMAYMNFKPGFSVGYEQFPSNQDHEVRERDYFFVVSFVVWALWAGLGLREWVRRLAAGAGDAARKRLAPALAYALFALALVPPVFNFREAGRRHGPDARLAADFAYDLLNSVPPYGVIFTFGDNDTFPLWWAQEVAGIRQDVVVVCLALAETDWYMRQLRDNPVRPFDEAAAPAVWRGLNPARPDRPVHNMTDPQIQAAVPQLLSQEVTLPVGERSVVLPAGTVLYGKDFVSLRIIQQNLGRRPLAWGLTAAGSFYGLDSLLVQRGLGIHLEPARPDSADPRYDFSGLLNIPLDLTLTQRLVYETYRYADLLEAPPRRLESTAAGIASTLGILFTQLGASAQARGDTAAAIRALRYAVKLSPSPNVRGMLQMLETGRESVPPEPR